jgi:hypothetical protein
MLLLIVGDLIVRHCASLQWRNVRKEFNESLSSSEHKDSMGGSVQQPVPAVWVDSNGAV